MKRFTRLHFVYTNIKQQPYKTIKPLLERLLLKSGEYRNRTGHLLHAMQALYQMS